MDKTKNKKNIPAPHDHYFKMAMSDRRVAREFFETHLPSELLELCDLEYLLPQPGSYIDDMRQEAIADMLFKTKIKNDEAFLYLVADHQSQPDKLMPFRILKYVSNIIDMHLKSTQSSAIPLVIPLVVYHGRQPWNFSTDIKDLIDAPRCLTDAFFLKSFQLIDLNKIDDEILKKKIWSGVMELTLKHVYDPDIIPFLHAIIPELKQILDQYGTEYVEATLVYMIETAESDKAFFDKLVKSKISQEIGEKVMTIAEQFRQEGWQEGNQKGIQQGLHAGVLKVAKRLISTGAEINLIAEVTQLTIKDIESLMVTE